MATRSWNSLTLDIIRWAEARRIIPNSTPEAQLLKTVDELGELVAAVVRKQPAQVEDAFNDVLVTLVIAADLCDVDLLECLANAYDEIKDRRGTMSPNGVFVKEEA